MKALLTLIMVKSLSVEIKLFLALNISNNIVIIVRLLFKLNKNEGFLSRKRFPSQDRSKLEHQVHTSVGNERSPSGEGRR
jgi:hypothetical protein